MTVNLLSEQEASYLGGVSVNTLHRFAQAGYLQIKETGNERLFYKDEIESVFGRLVEQPLKSNSQKTRPVTQQSKSLRDRIETLRTAAPAAGARPRRRTIQPKPTATQQINTSARQPKQKVRAVPDSQAQVDVLKRRLARLKMRISKRQHSIELKEQELQILKDQRNWLRNQIEKLEQKGERDQLLLLSETQTLAKLLQSQKKKSFLGLSWLRKDELTDEEQAKQSSAVKPTIDISNN